MRFLDREHLRARARARRGAYEAAAPFAHAVFDDFLGADWASEIAAAFPGPEHAAWLRRDYAEQSARLGQTQRTGFEGLAPALRHLLNELCAMAFVDFLRELTGHDGLIADPHYRGAGPSLTLPGGHLAVHVDFNRDRGRHLARAVTALYYAPREWGADWGGELELYGDPPGEPLQRILPLPDRLVVMAHTERSWHGHPAPLRCPEGHFRAAIGAYFYVADGVLDEARAHGAVWALGPR